MHIPINCFPENYAPFKFKNLAKIKKFVNAAPLKPLNRTLCNFIDKVDVHIHRKFWYDFFGKNMDLNWWNILLCKSCVKQLTSTWTWILNDIEAVSICFWKWISECYTNVTIIKLLCVFINIRLWFFVRLPITNAWNWHSLCAVHSSNVWAWGRLLCLALF